MFFKFSTLAILAFVLVCIGSEFVRANENENELSQKLSHLTEQEQEQSEIPEWFKRALPRMGKRFNSESDMSDSDEDDLSEIIDDYYENYYKRALPRMGRALPRMGRALPRMGRALPRMGRALPRMG